MARQVTPLLDSSIVIDFLRHYPAATAFIGTLAGPPTLSVVTISEIRAGQRNERERRIIDEVLGSSTLLPINAETAEIAGTLMRRFRKSHALETADALIAATAIHHGLELATLNIKHFPMFPGLKRPY